MKVFRSHMLICGGTGCHASGSIDVRKALVAEIAKRGLVDEIKVVETGCNGFCAQGPIIVVYPEGIIYMMVQSNDIPELVEEHLIKGRPLARLFYKEPATEEKIPTMQEIPFFALQELRVLRNRGLIDPENIDEYIARDGYSGMAKALTEMTPDQIIDEVEKSGLRGRGGGGFATARKWRTTRNAPGAVRYVICNGDEGDPGAFMDRSVMEGDPHSVIEGMAIAARAIEADEGQLNQVFSNIVINAAQAMPGGGTISISAESVALDSANAFSLPAGGYVRITFADTGCGMPEDVQKRIFDPYFTTKAKGSGLGLASAYSIIARHGGHISVRSHPGQGSTFDILLPAITQPAPRSTGIDTPVRAVSQGPKSLLVMDDEEIIREVASNMLVELGYRVQTCAGGDEAYALYKAARDTKDPFWAVIMDLTIPGGMGGIEAAQLILSIDPQACLIVSSGYSNDPVMSEYRAYGFSGAVAKPYSISEISTVLAGLHPNSRTSR